jgi:hypothetical protein
MKFDRYPHRPEPFEWTKRKLLAFQRKPERKLAAAQAAYPLLAELMKLPSALSSDAERGGRTFGAKRCALAVEAVARQGLT